MYPAFVLVLVVSLLVDCANPQGAGEISNAGARPGIEQAAFQVNHSIEVEVPDGAQRLRVWFPLPAAEDGQSVSDLEVDAPQGWRTATDSDGNRYVYAEVAGPKEKTMRIGTRFRLVRDEQKADVEPSHTRPYGEWELRSLQRYLLPSTHVVIDDDVEELAGRIVGGEDNPILASRLIYDWVLNNIEYWVKDPGRLKASAVGSSQYCLTSRTGNCTDFHSLWAALARASGIPTRMKYGSLFKPDLDGVDRDQSYHCWIEFWAPEIGWIPLDVAVADIFAGPIAIDADNREKVALTTADGYKGPDEAKVAYYFGNLEPRRVTWTVGRDLILEPPQSAGPVNAMPKGYVEVDGMAYDKWQRKLTFRQIR